LVAVLQVDEVGGGDPREMADFGGAFAAEIEGWAAEERVYGELRGVAQPHIGYALKLLADNPVSSVHELVQTSAF